MPQATYQACPRDDAATRTARGQRGSTLLEVLVSVIVLSLGMIGVLGVHTRGLATVDSSGYRAQASFLAAQILERARANPGGNYAVGYGAAGGGSSISAKDLQSWKTALARALPAGDAQITVDQIADAASGRNFNRLRVTVRWDDRRATGATYSTPDYKHLATEGFQAS